MSALADAVERLRQRVSDVIGGAAVEVGPPAHGEEPGAGATVTVLAVTPRHELSSDRQSLGLRLQFLVALRDASPWDELAALLTALAIDPCHDLSPDAPALELWRAFGVVPRPGIVVETTVHEPLELPLAPLVVEPLRVEVVPVHTLEGRIVGPRGVALPGAVVRLERTGARVAADRQGRFQLSVPPGPPGRLTVELKGRTIVVEPPEPLVEPIVISIDRLED